MTHGRTYLRGQIWWIAYWYKGKERRESSGSTERKIANLLLAKRLGEIGADTAGVKRWLGPEAERVLVTSLLDDLILAHEVAHSRSVKHYKARMIALRASFDRERVREVDTPRLRRYIQERERAGVKPATIQVELAVLRRAFNLAHQDGRIGSVPTFPTIRVDNARQGFFEQGDFEAVVKLLPPYLKDVARFAYLSGWRKEEILGLLWSEVDMAGRIIKLSPERSKNKKGRVLALVGELWEIIERRQGYRGVPFPDGADFYFCPFVFHREGQPIRHIRGAWMTACRRAGVEGMLFHDMRRTTVRNLLRAGVSQRTAMEVTGHKTASVFMRYDIVSEDDIRDAQEKMQSYLRAQGGERTIIPMEGHG